MLDKAIERCAYEIKKSKNKRWIIGYSGGKDSTATMKIFLSALIKSNRQDDEVTIIYCDTGVENLVLDDYVKACLKKIEPEIRSKFPNSAINILKAPVNERFFVRIIGRGYAPPTNKFRWCTKGLRVNPVRRYIKSQGDEFVVVLGLRYGESTQRDRSLGKSENICDIWQRQRDGGNYMLLLPIIDFDLEQVWAAVQFIEFPSKVETHKLEEIYRGATGECPMIKSQLSPPCASGRFGCWTCTVVRRDKSAENLILQGETHLQPYLDFRNWLQMFRTMKKYRWPVRRNGMNGPGPFTLEARKIVLHKLRKLEKEVDKNLLSKEELQEIKRLWKIDILKEEELQIG